MKNICLVDLDDTLADFKTPMMNALNRVTGQNIHWSAYDTFNVAELYGMEMPEFMQMLIDEQVIENTEIHPSSRQFLKDLHDLDYHTVLITARGWHPYGRALTQQWVAEHEIDWHIDELIVVDADQSKTDVIKKFGNIKFSIDDRIKHCREYTQTGNIEHVLVYDQPWNTNLTRWNHDWGGHDYDERITDLHEIINHVEWCEETDRSISNVC